MTNLAIGCAVLAVLLPLLLRSASGAPPTAAEFAPNARQVIRQAPPGQGVAATGGGATPNTRQATGSTTTSTTAAPPQGQTLAIPQNELKDCVGPPPLRQTEDPQSPPCIAYWLGKDNGGATAQGVTKDAVYIVIPTPESAEKQYTALENFFNKRFEFYGRKLVFEFCSSSGGGSGSADQNSQNADAALAASGCGGPKPFASTFYRQNNGRYYMQTMGCRYHDITMGSYSPYDSVYLNGCAPYLYQYPMDVDTEFANIGQWLCARLVGGNAIHAQGNDSSTPPHAMKSLKRKFGIFLAPFTADDPVATPSALRPITDRLHQCGVDIPSSDIIINPVTGLFDPSSAQNAVLQMKTHNITSIICMCNFFSAGTLQRAATSSTYHPEWITSTFGLNDANSSFLLGEGPADQMADTFGVTFQPRQVNPLLQPYNQSVQEGDPTQTPETDTTVEGKEEVYRALLLIASGIQMAGPDLTVASFRDGLRKTVFPNPITEIHAGFVGFAPNGWSMTDDGAEWWYSTTATGPFSDSSSHPGTICYVDGGARRHLGQWPSGSDPFFSGPCDSGA